MAIHGAMRSLTIQGRAFKTAHDAPGNKSIGGRMNEVAMNGDGTFRTLQTLTPGQLNNINVEIDESKGDLEFLQELSSAGLPVPVVAVNAANTAYTGDLVLTDVIEKDESTGLATLNFQGDPLTKI